MYLVNSFKNVLKLLCISIRMFFFDKREQSWGKKLISVHKLVYVVRVEIVISIDSGMSFCKITLIVHIPFSISVFTVKRCTLRSFDFLLLIASVWNLLFLVFFTSEFSWDTPSLLLTNRLSFCLACLLNIFAGQPPPDWRFAFFPDSKTINFIINGGLFLSLANKVVNSELFS